MQLPTLFLPSAVLTLPPGAADNATGPLCPLDGRQEAT